MPNWCALWLPTRYVQCTLGTQMRSSGNLNLWRTERSRGRESCNNVASDLGLKGWLEVLQEGHKEQYRSWMCDGQEGHGGSGITGRVKKGGMPGNVSGNTDWCLILNSAVCRVEKLEYFQVGNREHLEVFRQRYDKIRIALYKEDSECSVENDSWMCVGGGWGWEWRRKRVEARRTVLAILQWNPFPFRLPDSVFKWEEIEAKFKVRYFLSSLR